MENKVGNLEILAVHWLQGNRKGQIGIIKTVDTITKEIKYFVGYIENYTRNEEGSSEIEDIKEIIAWGTKFMEDEFYKLIQEM